MLPDIAARGEARAPVAVAAAEAPETAVTQAHAWR